MSNVNLFCFFACYVVVLGLELQRFVKRSTGRRFVMLGFAVAGLVAHTVYLLQRARQAELPPLLASSYDWMLVLAWIVVVFYLFLTLSNRDLPVGVFLLPVVLILQGVAYVISPPAAIDHADSEVIRRVVDRWSMLHSVLVVLGITGIILGLMHSMMYLVQHRRLRHHRLLLGNLKLPSLEKLALLNWWSIMLAVPLLTLGLITGIVLGLIRRDPDQAPFSFTDPTVLISLVAWIVMASFFFWLLRTDRPDGKQVASLTLWSCGFMLLTFLIQVMISSILGGRSIHLTLPTADRPVIVQAPADLPASVHSITRFSDPSSPLKRDSHPRHRLPPQQGSNS